MLSYLIFVLLYSIFVSSCLWFSSHFLFRFDQFEDCFKSSWGVWEGNQSFYLFLFYIVLYDILSCAYDYLVSISYLVMGALYDCHFVSQWFLIHFSFLFCLLHLLFSFLLSCWFLSSHWDSLHATTYHSMHYTLIMQLSSDSVWSFLVLVLNTFVS
jgi:hypothetical protein